MLLVATSAWLCALQINACEWAELQFNYVSGTMSTDGPGLACEADCNSDDDCAGELLCYHRGQTGKTNPPPGCYGSYTDETTDYCYDPNCDAYVIDYVGLLPDSELHNCQIDCDNDDEYAGDLICFERSAATRISRPAALT